MVRSVNEPAWARGHRSRQNTKLSKEAFLRQLFLKPALKAQKNLCE